jgi:hypothetical protein
VVGNGNLQGSTNSGTEYDGKRWTANSGTEYDEKRWTANSERRTVWIEEV